MLSSILQGWYGHCKDKSSEIFFPKHDQRENFYILYSVSHILYSQAPTPKMATIQQEEIFIDLLD